MIIDTDRDQRRNHEENKAAQIINYIFRCTINNDINLRIDIDEDQGRIQEDNKVAQNIYYIFGWTNNNHIYLRIND